MSKRPKITSIDSVWTVFDKELEVPIRKLLSYEDVYWKRGPFGNKIKKITVCMVKKIKGELYFHTGFVSRVLYYLDEIEIPYSYDTKIKLVSYDKPHVEGIKFRSDQNKIINKALQAGRGVVVSATGTGKSILILGLLSAFSQENCLFLVHTQDLVTQMKKDLEKLNIDVGEWTGNEKKKARVMVATIQSFKNVVEEYTYYFDCIFCDEGHHVNSLSGQYGKVLQNLAAPIKFAFTATLPTKNEGKFCLEGLIGPVIANFTLGEAIQKDILVKPRITIIEGPFRPVTDIYDDSDFPTPENRIDDPDYFPKKYNLIYWNYIVKNVERNLEILIEANENYKKGKSTLINVILLQHLEEIIELGKEYFPKMKISCIHGKIKKKERDKIKDGFEQKKIKCVVATVAWSEGINIKSLNCCILGGGGKAEIGLIQRIGRGTRKDTNKSVVDIIDFDDSGVPYMEKHFKKRISLYKKLKLI